MTAHAMEGDEEKCLAAGMDGYVSKPVNPQELLAAIERQLKQREPEPEAGVHEMPSNGETGPSGRHFPAVQGVPAYDKRVLLDRFEGDEETVLLVLRTFLGDAPRQIQLLKEALEREDAEAFRLQAHALKGAAGNVGAQALQQLSLEGERAGETGGLSGAFELVRRLEQAFEELKQVLDPGAEIPNDGDGCNANSHG